MSNVVDEIIHGAEETGAIIMAAETIKQLSLLELPAEQNMEILELIERAKTAAFINIKERSKNRASQGPASGASSES